MRKGFIFNHNKCVSCNACSAACILENEWNVYPRNIFTFNSDVDLLTPVINLSLACNHCESAVCMEGCPASAFSRESVTGAIIINEKKCIGCRYCQWNCPYDAPKFDIDKKVVSKCNLCFSGILEGRQPACTYACPTGALNFGEITDSGSKYIYSWFPDKNLNPAIEFTASGYSNTLKTVPENIFAQNEPQRAVNKKNILNEPSLLLFSFLATISVSTTIYSFVEGVFPGKMIFIPFLILTGLVSFFHLGKVTRSWRSLTNLRTSPLSREIAAFIIYSFTGLTAVLFHIPVLLIAASLAGLIFLVMIDGVYVFSNNNRSIIQHSGQTFITGLLMISFFSGLIFPFIFIALIKLWLSVHCLRERKINSNLFGIRYLRIVFLIISGASIISHISFPGTVIVFVFLLGELIDRVLFYFDFNPLNINTLITEQQNIERDEKKGG
jgi:Fe-S-cluster-containing dehydrogenase component/DMSO reductase anchor subunit